MKTALFTNFSNEPFTGFWDGKAKTFTPGQQVYMPDYLAAHFAKHLTNRELLKKGLERSTSPKRPEDVPEFMELYNQAYQPDEDEPMTQQEDGIDVAIAVANKNRQKREALGGAAPQGEVDPTQPQVILPPDDEDDEEGEFGGKPVEKPAAQPGGIGLAG